MPRAPRAAAGGIIYHVLNRANARMTLFETPADYQAFFKVLLDAHEHVSMRTLAFCVLPNHWHLVLWPRGDGDLSAFTRWLTLTHTQRWHAARRSAGTGHVYQGRFKSFPVQSDGHFIRVCRYVERNALRAGLVDRAEAWPWGSLWHRLRGVRGGGPAILSAWPVDPPPDWVRRVNAAESEAELAALREALRRGRPYGADPWVARIADRLDLGSTLRPRGRPRQGGGAGSEKGS